ncbi:unnamed protein product [Closterium sp. NIES-54]
MPPPHLPPILLHMLGWHALKQLIRIVLKATRRLIGCDDMDRDAEIGEWSVSAAQPDALELVEVAVDSGAARGAESRGAEPGGAESGGAESGGAEPGGAEPGGAESGGAEPGGAESGGAESARPCCWSWRSSCCY